MVLNQAKIVQKLKNLPKTLSKISKNFKFPANPLLEFCRQIVQKKPAVSEFSPSKDEQRIRHLTAKLNELRNGKMHSLPTLNDGLNDL